VVGEIAPDGWVVYRALDGERIQDSRVEGRFAVTRAGLYELGDLRIDRDVEFWTFKRRR
jgi:hypothetical protein